MKTQTLHNQLVEWRHDLHMHPQISFEEEYASKKVSTLLKEFGIEVHRGFAKTGVVGRISNGQGPSIGLRADMDALPLQEKNLFDHKKELIKSKILFKSIISKFISRIIWGKRICKILLRKKF